MAMTRRFSLPREAPARFALSRRQALVGASAAALTVAIGMPGQPASAAIAFTALNLTDMTGHVPPYNAAIGFGRPAKSAVLINDPYDLIFA